RNNSHNNENSAQQSNQNSFHTVLREIAKTFKDAIVEVNLITRTPKKETNLVQVELFYGTKKEDPSKWVKMFNCAANANN
ncbi:5144_t:CDS:1, partial [Cetraspora pellucida]